MFISQRHVKTGTQGGRGSVLTVVPDLLASMATSKDYFYMGKSQVYIDCC